MPRFACSALSLALLTGAAGCGSIFQAGGDTFSNDHFTYESTTWSPKSVELIDTRTGQTLWSLDVPVGQKVTMRFTPEHGDRDESFPDRMTWVVQRLKGDSWRGKKSMLVPGPNARLVEVSLRPTPEFPPQTAASPELPELEPEIDANGLEVGG